MARADVAVLGAGLAGLTAAISLAEAGARVQVLAAGHAATHWTHGGIDAGADPSATTPADAVARLAGRPGHPYQVLAGGLADLLAWLRATLAGEGLVLVGALDDPLRPIPTSIGLTRPAAIVPDAVAAALPAWGSTRRSSSAVSPASGTTGRTRSRPAWGWPDLARRGSAGQGRGAHGRAARTRRPAQPVGA